ncbi:hypothetical protein Acsp06_51080 [Actinomycetospora sp. NBRC 106375]|uniref:hypothetical protein n=1 Tax=Actinomycetospora sp. NBRC 106375 TaxID=3032207 RepID=UPI0024A5045C|nr:hypothetical protein [Actinomycetospora sp. NBRC 106375]GLZ48923.1 hypothetical protein Acsp06_51080 [Actinomycetospora sp. NBRC 106375]
MPAGPGGRPGRDPTADGPPRFDPTGPAAAPVARDLDALAEPVAAAVLACPGVAGLSGGPYGTVGTYLPGRRVTGVQITDHEITVRIVARLAPLRRIEAEVRAAVAPLLPGLPVHLGVDDIDAGDAHGPTIGNADAPTSLGPHGGVRLPF